LQRKAAGKNFSVPILNDPSARVKDSGMDGEGFEYKGWRSWCFTFSTLHVCFVCLCSNSYCCVKGFRISDFGFTVGGSGFRIKWFLDLWF
jgi:hypothetical protein